jgi:pimeloyl-ACP methyl ester carboxylesterase
MGRILALSLWVSVLTAFAASAAPAAPGLYRDGSNRQIYVGIEDNQPNPAANQYFDPLTQRTGELPGSTHLTLQKGIAESRRSLDTTEGPLGVSLYYIGTNERASIILVHGNDPETRDMGFLIPYFVLNGINVISYDQRGTGQSTGNWLRAGPTQRARDVEAIYDAFVTDPHVDAKRLGIWAFSNGGWTAPIVATTRPIAFMILKSPPAESIASNVYYSVVQHMHEKHYDAAAISAALATWRTVIGALSGTTSWNTVRTAYSAASTKPWFAASYIPALLNIKLPPTAVEVAGLQELLLYDPAVTLQKVKTPTLAVFGARDRNVDVAHASVTLRLDFAHAGMKDFTERIFKNAGHTLKISTTGFNDQPIKPERLTKGYPRIMIQWLRRRSFLD